MMMMAQKKNLRDLLVEDQEPFLLDAYISSLRLQLNRPPRPPSPGKPPSFLMNANSCFSSSSASRPPRLDAATSAARVRSKTAGDNALLLRVPTRTAALLLEAALRIETYGLKDRGPLDRKKQGKSGGVAGQGGSLFRKFTRFGRRSRKKEYGGCEGDDGVLVRDILRLDNYGERQKQGKTNAIDDSVASVYADECPCSTSDTSDAHMYESEQIRGRESFSGSEGSGLGRSPFRYSTPELRSPTVASPTRSLPMDKANDEESDPRDFRPDGEEEEEVEKEQSSPVSVLDPPPSYHEDDNTREHKDAAEDPDDNDGYEYDDVDHGVIDDYEASYTRTKQQLLRKLYMFERLAGLDPVELNEQLILQDDSEDEEVVAERGGDEPARRMRATRGTVRLVSNLILGEPREVKRPGRGMDMATIQGYYRRNGMMMVRRDEEEEDHLEDTAEEIEVSILGFLVEELSEELCLQWGVL